MAYSDYSGTHCWLPISLIGVESVKSILELGCEICNYHCMFQTDIIGITTYV